MSKMDSLSCFMADESLHVLGVGETWLLESDSSSFVAVDGFTLIRSDVRGDNRKHGVAVYVADALKFEEVELDLPNLVILKLMEFAMTVIVAYRPPSYNDIENNKLCDALWAVSAESEVLILGDFNLPSLKWDSNLPRVYVPRLDQTYLDLFTALGLTQCICSPTYIQSNNILDLVLTSEADRIGNVEVHPPLPRCLHSPVVCDCVFQFGTTSDEVHGGV